VKKKKNLFVLCHGLVGYHVSQRHRSPKVSVVVGDINGGWRALQWPCTWWQLGCLASWLSFGSVAVVVGVASEI
jgi:hypothetical protein